jgi:hypothetical protein
LIQAEQLNRISIRVGIGIRERPAEIRKITESETIVAAKYF